MLDSDEEDRVLRLAVEKGWLSETELTPVPAATAKIATGIHFGRRIDLLIQAGILRRIDVERILREQGLHKPEAVSQLAATTDELVVQDQFASTLNPILAGLAPDVSAVSQRQETEPQFQPPVSGWERYEILSLLGKGGMGTVYKARDGRLSRFVALKFIRMGPSASVQRFFQEARAQARINHKHICKVYEVGEVEGKPYIAMEFIEGFSLLKVMGQLRLEEKVYILRDIAQAMHAAHRLGIVHRDLKPSNVMVQKDEQGEWRAVVTDFGLAHDPEAEQQLTKTGMVLGTPAYMSPEQARGDIRQIDRRTDIYSLGAMLYELLTGTPPFVSENTVVTVLRVLQEDPVRVRKRAPTIPPDLETITMKCLEKDSSRRYESAQALAQDLQAYLSGEMIRARNPSLFYRVQKQARKHKAILMLAAAMPVALLLAALGTIYFQNRRKMDSLCLGGQSKLVGVWDEARKHAIRAAFLSSGLPYAKDSWPRLENALNQYTGAWVTMHNEVCRATLLRGEQSQSLMDLRMQCLSRRLQEVNAYVAHFSRPDAAVVERAVQTSNDFPPLSSCADIEALTAPVRPPEDPLTRAQVNDLYRQLAEIRASSKLGKYAEVIQAAKAAVQAAQKLSYHPAEAEALYLLGDLEQQSGDAAAAEQTLYRAAVAAKAGRHHQVEAQAWAALTLVVGYQLKRPAEGHRWGELARAAVDATLGNEAVKADLLNSLGNILMREERYQEALASLREAYALREKLLGPAHLEVAGDLNDIANALRLQGRLEEALSIHFRALRIQERILPEGHPILASKMNNIAFVLRDQGKLEAAERYMRQALEIRRTALGEEHPKTLETWVNLAVIYERQGRNNDARAIYERVLIAQAKGLDPAALARTRFYLAKVLWSLQQDRKRAIELVEAARSALARLGEGGQTDLNRIEAWLNELKASGQLQ